MHLVVHRGSHEIGVMGVECVAGRPLAVLLCHAHLDPVGLAPFAPVDRPGRWYLEQRYEVFRRAG